MIRQRKRKLPSGLWDRNGVYYSRFRANGKVIVKRLSSDFKVASEILVELKAKYARAAHGMLDNDYLWADLKKEFLRWARQHVKEHDKYEQELGRFEKYQAVRNIQQITPEYVFGYRDWRLTHAARKELSCVSPRTVNKEVGTLRNMLNKGVEWGKLRSNPVAGIQPLPHTELAKERRALTLEEAEALFAISTPRQRTIWRMFMLTGLRRNELVKLKFSHVDFERRCLTVIVANAKSKKAREIPLDDESLEVITKLRDEAASRTPTRETKPSKFSRDHVFVTKDGHPLANNLLRTFYANCKRAGIEDAHPGGAVDIHSLRVTYATLAMENGANPKAVQAILGHSTLAMTMGIYTKATEKSKREAVAAIPFAKVTAPKHVLALAETA